MSLDFAISKLFQRIEELERIVNNQARQINNMVREGRVVEAYPEDGTAVVETFGDGSKSKRHPWFTQAGGISDFVPLSVNQRVVLISPTGETGKGIILPGGYTDEFAQPHNQGDQAMRKIGDSSDLMTGTRRRIVADEIELVGNVRIKGGVLTHNEVNVGDDHRHKEVMPGPSLTGEPA